MNEKIREHKHCKECSCVIVKPNLFDISYYKEIENYIIGYCDSCLIKKGRTTVQSKREKEK